MNVITNNHERQFMYGYDVPSEVHQDYDWLDENEHDDGWINYRGNWYHISDFMQAPASMAPWSGYFGETAFSAIVIELSDDGETYRIGLALS